MVSSQDIDSLLGALVCVLAVDVPEIFELDKSADCCLSCVLLGGSYAKGEEGLRGDRGGGIYWLSIGGARLTLVSVTRSLRGDLE